MHKAAKVKVTKVYYELTLLSMVDLFSSLRYLNKKQDAKEKKNEENLDLLIIKMA